MLLTQLQTTNNIASITVLQKDINLAIHTYGAYIKFHRKRNLAPLGVYFAIGLNLQNLSLNNLILPTLEYNSPLTSANYKAIDLGISLTWEEIGL